MYLTKERLAEAGIDAEKVDKFAELFPNGTEVTRELCVKHPDVFSFGGLPGARLALRGCKADKARKKRAADKFFMMMVSNPEPNHRGMKDLPTLDKAFPSAGLPVGTPFPFIPCNIPIMPTEEYNLKLALLFYETSIM
jgi:hypothetical protein